jgi:general secretion pathway protein G
MKKNATVMRRGFSLLELLIVIAILGLLAAIVAPNLMGAADKAKRDTTCLKMSEVKKALDMFKLDNGTYPETEEGLQALVSNPDPEKYPNYSPTPYMKSVPKDAWNTPFIYINKGDDVELISYGADKKEGGSGSGEDIFMSRCKKH